MGLLVKTLLVLIILQNCIEGIIGETEVLHEDMQLHQLVEMFGVAFVPISYTFFLDF